MLKLFIYSKLGGARKIWHLEIVLQVSWA